ncbi:MAG TPA: hypothetical protein VLU43_15895 [Anaeromyxobacteraceae bacterium]|nr:hypothetical protein [Anaeromyxobacteraceae bacterium]
MITGNRSLLLLVAAVALSPLGVRAHAEVGSTIDNVELKTLAGGREKLLSNKARANVMIFFRPNQDRSVEALRQMAQCEKDLAGKPVHWVAIVSATEPAEGVRTVVQQTGIAMPVLVDEGDALYDKLGVRLHPLVVIADGKFKLVATEMYRQIEFCDMVRARIRFVIGELDEAGLDKVLNPARSALPGEDLAKKAMRDVNMARKLIDLDQADKAIERCQRALELSPTVAAAYSVMGDAYAKQGDCAKAKQQWQAAQKLDVKATASADGQKRCP